MSRHDMGVLTITSSYTKEDVVVTEKSTKAPCQVIRLHRNANAERAIGNSDIYSVAAQEDKIRQGGGSTGKWSCEGCCGEGRGCRGRAG